MKDFYSKCSGSVLCLSAAWALLQDVTGIQSRITLLLFTEGWLWEQVPTPTPSRLPCQEDSNKPRELRWSIPADLREADGPSPIEANESHETPLINRSFVQTGQYGQWLFSDNDDHVSTFAWGKSRQTRGETWHLHLSSWVLGPRQLDAWSKMVTGSPGDVLIKQTKPTVLFFDQSLPGVSGATQPLYSSILTIIH